ncbi:MAG: FIST C-terminal domain-containing protein [Oscillospiraceae bacterium]|nr:FIST C-terminal domain-containing protein [Oscillospiraceae bacterium]
MIKTKTAQTAELDDENLAIEQIKAQLEMEGGYLKSTVGIVSCHYEFVHSGVFKAICDALPFDVVGAISSSQAVSGEVGSLLLTLTVLTSDDLKFSKILTPSLLEEPGKAIAESYRAGCIDLKEEKPALILTFAPFILQNTGDEYVNVLTEASGGVPCFGTITVDDTMDFSNCFVLVNGEHYREQMAMLLIYGDISPKFYVANISEDKMLEKSAVVTKSAGPVLMEVNERPVIDYFEDLGLVEASETQYAMTSLPFLLDYNDNTPKVSKIFVSLTPEKYAICAGAMPEGSTLYMATSDKEDILFTTGEVMDAIKKDMGDASALLAYSCISRSMTLTSDQFKEMELVDKKLGGKLPFMMVTSGGEICPTQTSKEKAINRFHNNAFIACLL